ncbi:MAG: FtsX-like permease family protein [Cyclobacteriaceae bacterium]
MRTTALKKVGRDLLREKGRTLTVMTAIVLGVFAVAMLIFAKSVLDKNLATNYLNTNPASFYIELDSVTKQSRNELAEKPNIEFVEIRPAIKARLKKEGGEFVPVLLFLVESFDDLRINTFNLDQGSWPGTSNKWLIEREGQKIMELSVGQQHQLVIPGWETLDLELSGLSHDPGVAPSWMEGMLYGYLSMEALPEAVMSQKLNRLMVTVAEGKLDENIINDQVLTTKKWFEAQGVKVIRTEVPKPGVHMHQRQMNALMFLVLLFGLLTLGLSSLLVINMISAVMSKEIRQIALMKATGASTGQITMIYLMIIGIMSVLALLIAMPLGLFAGWKFAEFNASLLNFTLYDVSIEWSVYLLIIGTGMLLPLVLSFVPIYRASRVSIHHSLNNAGVEESALNEKSVLRQLLDMLNLSSSLTFAIRNTFRRKGRLILTVLCLAMGGAIFITSFNLRKSTTSSINKNFDQQGQDVVIGLKQPVLQTDLDRLIKSVSSVASYETGNVYWGSTMQSNQLNSRSFKVRSLPIAAELYRPELVQGRWFEAGKTEVVVNKVLLSDYEQLGIGRSIELVLQGKTETYEIVGIVNELFSPSGLFLSNDQVNQHLGISSKVNQISLQANDRNDASIRQMIRAVEGSLQQAGITVVGSTPKSVYKKLVVEHLVIIMMMLLVMTFLVIVVGGMGMATSFNINVSERKREIGILQAVGIEKAQLRKIIVSEGLVVGLLSWFLAILLSFPVSWYLGNEFFELFFESTLVLRISEWGILFWLIAVVVLGAWFSYQPAKRAYAMPTAEVISYE